MNRVLKQFLFGGILLALIAGIVFFIFRGSFFITPTCSDGIQNQGEEGIDCGNICGISCEQKYPKELIYTNLQMFRLGDLISVDFDLNNPNQNLGLKNFKYQIDFYGFADKLLGSVTGNSFIYPAQDKKIVEAGQKILGDIKYAKVIFSALNWSPSSEFRSIKLENQNPRTYKDGDFYAVSGKIKNLYSFDIPQTEISAFLMDNSGNVLGVSKTKFDNLPIFGERDYKVLIAIDKNSEQKVDFSATKIFIYPTY